MEPVVELKLSGKNKAVFTVSECDKERVEQISWRLWSGYVHNDLAGALHQFVMGPRPDDVPENWVIDHIDRLKLNNCRNNLRWVSPSFNSWNKTINKAKSSRFRNVCWDKSQHKWKVSFLKQHYGCFSDELEAGKAAAKAIIRHWPLWGPTSSLLVGENLLTFDDITQIQQDIANEEAVTPRARDLPVGVMISGKKFGAVFRREWLGTFQTVEAAKAVRDNVQKQYGQECWEQHLKLPIIRDGEGSALIQLSGAEGAGKYAKVPEEFWHVLTYRHKWCLYDGYAKGSWNQKNAMLHVVVYKLSHPDYEVNDETIDHVDASKKLDNRMCNLRLATSSLQAYNKKKKDGCSSKYRGVYFKKSINRWIASLRVLGTRHNAGSHLTEDEAARALNQKARELLGANATLLPVPDL